MVQPDLGPLEGTHLRFRLVTPDDAAYIQRLRTTPDYGRFLSSAAPSIDAQREWIDRYKVREAKGQEYYFMIERLDNGRRCGVVRLYEINDGCFTWGSWILDENKSKKAALDSALLIYRTAFGALGLHASVFDVRLENTRTIAFHRRFGAIETGADAQNVYFRLEAARFAQLEPDLQAHLDASLQ